MATPRTRLLIVGGIILALVLVGGWFGGRAYVDYNLKNPFSTSDGYMGDFVFWNEGETSVVFFWPKADGAYKAITNRPVWMIVARFGKGTQSSGFNSQASTDNQSSFDLEEKSTVTFPSGETLLLRHAYSSKDPVEKFTAGDRSFPAEKGRLFLLDLTGEQPQIDQVNADLSTALGSWAGNKDEVKPLFRLALAKIRAQHPEVNRFLIQMGGPIAAK